MLASNSLTFKIYTSMIRNYTPPRLTIETRFDLLPEAVAQRNNPVVIGPLYQLQRYGFDDITGVRFDNGGTALPYTGTSPDDMVDGDYTRVFGEDLEAHLNTYPSSGAGSRFLVKSSAEAQILKFIDDATTDPRFVRAEDPSDLDASLENRPMQTGDIVRVTAGGTTSRRVVIGFQGEDLDPEVAEEAEAATSNPGLQSTFEVEDVSTPGGWGLDLDNPTLYDARIQGPVTPDNFYGDRYILTVTGGGDNTTAQVSIRTYSGLFSADGVVSIAGSTAQDFEFSSPALAGVTVELEAPVGQTQLIVGQTFAFTIKGVHTPVDVDNATFGSRGLQVDPGSTFTGPANTMYVIRVVEGLAAGTSDRVSDARVRVTDTAGIDTPYEFDLIDDTYQPVGNFGVQARFVSANLAETLKANDVFTIEVKAARQSTERFDKVVLNGPAVDTSSISVGPGGLGVQVRHRMPFTGEIFKKEAPDGVPNFENGSIGDGVSVRSNLRVFVTERNANPGLTDWVSIVRDTDVNGDLEEYEVGNLGTLFLTFRAVKPRPAMDGPIRIDSVAQLREYGTITPDNTLLYGAHAALRGGDDETVLFMMQLRTNDLDGYREALDRLSVEDVYYAIVPLTDDNVVKREVFEHARFESGRTRMNFRAAYVGTDSPGEYSLIGTRPSGGSYTATVQPTQGGNRLVKTTDVNLLNLDISGGDHFRTNYGTDLWGEPTFEEYEIVDVLNESELLLKSGPSAPFSVPQKFEIWKPDTAEAAAQYVRSVSRSLSSGFGANIWSDNPYREVEGRLQQIPNYFGAAYYAGLRTSVAPHQPLTRAEFDYYAASPGMYSRFTDAILNTIAADGTMIIHHRAPLTTPFVRHQLWTDVTSVLTREDSIRTNVNFILYELKDILDPFVGRRNANTSALIAIRNAVDNTMTENTQADLVEVTDLGPRLISYEIIRLRILPQQADTIDLVLRITVPAPINNIDVIVGVGVTDEEITVDLNPQSETN